MVGGELFDLFADATGAAVWPEHAIADRRGCGSGSALHRAVGRVFEGQIDACRDDGSGLPATHHDLDIDPVRAAGPDRQVFAIDTEVVQRGELGHRNGADVDLDRVGSGRRKLDRSVRRRACTDRWLNECGGGKHRADGEQSGENPATTNHELCPCQFDYYSDRACPHSID